MILLFFRAILVILRKVCNMKNFESDIRIVSILDSAGSLISQLDPDGIFGEMNVTFFKISSRTGRWSTRLSFGKREDLLIEGSLSQERRLLIDRFRLVDGKDDLNLKIVPAYTLSETLGDVSQHPERVRIFLASLKSVCRTRTSVLNPQDQIFFDLCIDAIFNDVDGGSRSEDYRNRFSELRVSYEEDGVLLTTHHPVDEGRIVVSCRMNRFGISGKKVRLEWNFGMGYSTFSDCIFRLEDKTCPSVRLAFDLADNLKGMYSRQRFSAKGKGLLGLK